MMEVNGATVQRDEYCGVGGSSATAAENAITYKSHALNAKNVIRKSFDEFKQATAVQN